MKQVSSNIWIIGCSFKNIVAHLRLEDTRSRKFNVNVSVSSIMDYRNNECYGCYLVDTEK